MDCFNTALLDLGLNYGKNKKKKMWRSFSEEDRDRINRDGEEYAKDVICMHVIGEPFSNDEEFLSRWYKHTNQTKYEFEELIKELESLL